MEVKLFVSQHLRTEWNQENVNQMEVNQTRYLKI